MRGAGMTDDYRPDAATLRYYPEAAVGGYPRIDGELEFYTRINALVDADSRVLDFGAGRAQWAVEPAPEIRKRMRHLQGRVAEVVGTDVDDAVLENPAVDRALVVDPGKPLPFPDNYFDVVIADYVLEHVDREHAQAVADDILRVLKPGGWFAARTPNRWGLIGVAARVIPNNWHVRFLKNLQPDRKAEDVFPVRYQMNTRRQLRRLFSDHDLYTYGIDGVPTYFEHHPVLWHLASLFDRLTPRSLTSTWQVFVRKR